MNKIKIGKIVNAVSLKGEVKVYNYSHKERYEGLEEIIVMKNNKDSRTYKIENVRYQKDMIILKLQGVDDRNASEALKDYDIFIDEDSLEELPEDTFYIKDLVGLKAIDETNGKPFGTVEDILQNSAQDLYKIKTIGGEEVLIPGVKQFIKKISLDQGMIVFSLIPGLVDRDYETIDDGEEK